MVGVVVEVGVEVVVEVGVVVGVEVEVGVGVGVDMTLEELFHLCSESKLSFVPPRFKDALQPGARVRKQNSEGPDLHRDGEAGTIERHAVLEGHVVGYWVRWDVPGKFTGLTFAIVPKIAPIA